MKLRWNFSVLCLALCFHVALAAPWFKRQDNMENINKVIPSIMSPPLPSIFSTSSIRSLSQKSISPSSLHISTDISSLSTSKSSSAPTSSFQSQSNFSTMMTATTETAATSTSLLVTPSSILDPEQDSEGLPPPAVIAAAMVPLIIVLLAAMVLIWQRRLRRRADMKAIDKFDMLDSIGSFQSPTNTARTSNDADFSHTPRQEMVVVTPPAPAKIDSWDRYLLELQKAPGVDDDIVADPS